MYKSFVYKWLPLRLIKNECVSQFCANKRRHLGEVSRWARCMSISSVNYKKRRSEEERAAESHGRRVIKYSPKASSDVIGIWRNMTVQEIAGVLQKDVDHVFKALEFADKDSMVHYTKNTVIHNPQIVRDVIKISGFRYKIVARPDAKVEEEENRDAVAAPPAAGGALRPRPPVACVMGHVDHGKTTLLDALRDTAVVDTEFGGITQHIGAFEVRLPSGEQVTFLDTPGHAAFAAMRSRGARATDVVVLVVAADDGVMEQTVESIRMARAANVPILVAINKIDKPGVNIERTMRALAQHGVVCEAVGGDVQAVPVSALRKLHLDTLVEALTLQAQLMELKADPGGYVEGVVLEAQVDPRAGKQATVLVQRGTLRRGCVIVAGLGWAKVRVLYSADGRPMQEAPPASPACVLGWRELPAAGDQVLEVESERRAAEVMKWRHAQRMKEKQQADLEVISAKEAEHQSQYRQQLRRKRALGRLRLRPDGPRQKMLQPDSHPTLSVLVKGDVDGSVEAILDILETYDEHERVRLELVHCGVGQLAPNDLEVLFCVMQMHGMHSTCCLKGVAAGTHWIHEATNLALKSSNTRVIDLEQIDRSIAEAFNATIYAFNVECPANLAVEAKNKNVPIKRHNVIYKLVDDVKEEINARIPKRQEEEIIGEANVLQEFQVSEGKKKVPVAGCRCVKGSLAKNALYRIIREGEVVFQGKLESMKHLKEEVNTIKRDQECGLRFSDAGCQLRPGDTVQCYKLVDVASATGWDPGF